MARSKFYFPGSRKPNFSKIKRVSYDDYWTERGFQMRSKLMEREVIFFDWITRGSTVLDVGCGTSRLLFELKAQKQCRVSGAAISPLVVASLQQAGIDAFVANIEDSAFQLIDHYDYIICSETIEHLSQPEELIAKLKAAADYLVPSVPNSAFYRYRLGLMFRGRFFTQWMSHPSEHLRYWSHTDFLDWLSAMGLTVVTFKASNGFELKDILPNMFGHQICYLAKTNR